MKIAREEMVNWILELPGRKLVDGERLIVRLKKNAHHFEMDCILLQ